MKKWFLFILLCAALAYAPAVYASSGGGGHGGEAKKEKKNENKDKKKDAASITGGMNELDPLYLHLPPIVLPIINDYGAQQIVSMIIDIKIKDRQAGEKMQADLPKIRDALFQALYGGLADGSMRNAHALNIPVIKENIVRTINKVYNAEYAQEVFIQAVTQRKL